MLAGKVVLITGGSGAIGAALCRTAAAHGATVAFTFHRKAERAAELAADLEARGTRCLAGEVDGRDGAAVERFTRQVEERFERVDALVNNIGAAQVMPFALIDEADWDDAMAVNLKTMFLFSKAVVRGMIRRRAGAIVNLGSIAGHRLLEVPVHYATAKAGVMGFTLSLAKELCRYGVRVNAVVPGLIEGGVGSNVSERQLAEYQKHCALGRVGQPAEVAELACFLASDRAAYVNAQCMMVDGGL
ncbi:MAG TPA: SDR family NAD(P)-dependent oxidoreductase [Polyangia bacterium]|jgi:NAD(P)-dependent dehydrogenase (short-subunit alcohol dehydrogenase family)